MFMVLAFRPTHALLINGYEHWGNMLQLHGCHGWEEDYSIR